MDFLETVTKILGVVTAVFSALGSIYAFIRWIRGKGEMPPVSPKRPEDNASRWEERVDERTYDRRTSQDSRRNRQPVKAPLWPWLVCGGIVLMWVMFFGLLFIGMALANTNKGTTQTGGLDDKVVLGKNSISLSGTWTEPGGNVVSITHNGQQVTIRMVYLEQMIGPANATLHGSVAPSADPRYRAVITVANHVIRAQLYLTHDGNRMEGSVVNAYQTTPAVLLRQ